MSSRENSTRTRFKDNSTLQGDQYINSDTLTTVKPSDKILLKPI